MTRTPSLSTRLIAGLTSGLLAVAGMAGITVAVAAPAAAATSTVYNSIPAVYPATFVSQAFEATSTSEFGDYVQLAGTARALTTVTVGLTNWSCENWAVGGTCVTTPASSFVHPITLNVYAVDNSGALPVPGALLKTVTKEVTVPFRPSADTTNCSSNKWFDSASGTCYNGFAFNADFDLGGVVVPGDVIVAVAFNTQHHGATPTTVAGPYDSLNVSVVGGAAAVGTDENIDEMFVNSTWAGNYSDNGAGGTGTLRVDTGWATYGGLVLRIDADEPDPAPTNVACGAIATGPVASNTSTQGWDFSQTRANGSNEFVAGGLKVTTVVGDSLAKAAGYKAIDIPLSDAGDIAIDLSDTAGSIPSVQLGVDLDNDGTQDGYLVYEESFYGQNLWASNPIVNHVPAFVGLPTVGGGGSSISGTIDQYLLAYPSARILSFGYSLGSGVVGTAVINSITVGCVEYGFDYITPNQTCSAIATGPVATDGALQGWDFSQTRANGSNVFTANGLTVTTVVGDSLAKAAGYKAIDIPLTQAGQLDIELSDSVGSIPGVQLGVDLDNDGAQDGYLVYEPGFYGNNLWASNPIVNHVPAFVGLPTVGGGGSSISGTIDQYLLAYPSARILSFGYSLGSGVVGTTVIHSITVGCTKYAFASPMIPGAPVIEGAATVGQTLTANEGTWAPSGVTFTYQWKANGSPISGADQKTYVLQGADSTKTIVVVVTGHKTGLLEKSATSPGRTIAPGTLTSAVPTIAGTAEIGATLTAAPGTWGPAPVELSYQWLADGVPIEGADGPHYLITFSDAGKSLSVTVTGTKLGYTPRSETSLPTLSLPTDAIPVVERLAGADRYATAIQISQGFAPGVSRVYLATGLNYPDALSAAAAAAHFDAPLLLTTPGSLPSAVRAELVRLHPAEVVIVGGESVVSPAVASAVGALSFDPDVTRLGGADRYETSRLIADEAFASAATAYIATGSNFPDALSAGPAAAHFDGPVILVNGQANSVGIDTLQLLSDLGVDTVKIAGGTAAVSAAIQTQLDVNYDVTRNQGGNRFDTAIAINDDEFTSASTIYLATGLSFPDALAGAARAGFEGAPLFVTTPDCIPAPVMVAITQLNPSKVVLLGGTAALSAAVATLDTCS